MNDPIPARVAAALEKAGEPHGPPATYRYPDDELNLSRMHEVRRTIGRRRTHALRQLKALWTLVLSDPAIRGHPAFEAQLAIVTAEIDETRALTENLRERQIAVRQELLLRSSTRASWAAVAVAVLGTFIATVAVVTTRPAPSAVVYGTSPTSPAALGAGQSALPDAAVAASTVAVDAAGARPSR
jgi:hypothetical protein